MPRRSPTRRDAAVAGLLAAGGYVAAALNLAALSWDGSWYLFRSLQDGAPFIPHVRYGTYPILWLLVQASKIIHDPRMLGVCYGLLLALFPLGSLALSWYYLRGEERAPLRIWPALGILLTPLPGQFCLMSEATPAAQLLWPVLAIIAAGPPGLSGGFWLALLSAVLCFLHPTAVLIFAFAAVLCGCQAWKRPGVNQGTWVWAGTFVALAAGKLMLTVFSANDYERSQASWKEVLGQFSTSVFGLPLLMLMLTYLLGFIVVMETEASRQRLNPGTTRILCAGLCALLAGAGLCWVRDPARWEGLLDYRRFVLPATLPLVALAMWHHRSLTLLPKLGLQPAPWLLSWVAAAFGVVLIAQSLVWKSLIEHFAKALTQRAAHERFVAANELPFTRHTVLRHWTACPLSLLLQGRQPPAVFVLRREDIQSSSVQVNPWEQIPLTDSWFRLKHLTDNEPDAR